MRLYLASAPLPQRDSDRVSKYFIQDGLKGCQTHNNKLAWPLTRYRLKPAKADGQCCHCKQGLQHFKTIRDNFTWESSLPGVTYQSLCWHVAITLLLQPSHSPHYMTVALEYRAIPSHLLYIDSCTMPLSYHRYFLVITQRHCSHMTDTFLEHTEPFAWKTLITAVTAQFSLTCSYGKNILWWSLLLGALTVAQRTMEKFPLLTIDQVLGLQNHSNVKLERGVILFTVKSVFYRCFLILLFKYCRHFLWILNCYLY